MTDKPDDPPTIHPREAPTPRPRLRREASDALEAAQAGRAMSSHPPMLHSTEEPVDVVAALAQMIAHHELKEQEMLDKRDQAAEQRLEARLTAHHDRLAVTNKTNFHEEALGIASPFLERFEAWQKAQGVRINTLETTVEDHETRLKKVEALQALQATVAQVQKDLDEIKRQLKEHEKEELGRP